MTQLYNTCTSDISSVEKCWLRKSWKILALSNPFHRTWLWWAWNGDDSLWLCHARIRWSTVQVQFSLFFHFPAKILKQCHLVQFSLFHCCQSSHDAISTLQVQVLGWLADDGGWHTLLWRPFMEWLRPVLPRWALEIGYMKFKKLLEKKTWSFSPVPPSPPLLEVKVGGVSSSMLKPGTLALISCTAQVSTMLYFKLKFLQFAACSIYNFPSINVSLF